MATTREFLGQLVSLAQLDIDAVHAYTAAINRIDIVDVKRQLNAFRRDHERHVTELSAVIQRLGGEAPKPTPDFKGFFIQGFTAIKSMMGNESALKAMKGNEELTNKTYDKALEHDFPEDIRDLIRGNRDDERRHLAYVERCIADRVWEDEEKRAA